MGHFNNTVTGTGRNKAEAQRDAIDNFLAQEDEEGRHTVYDCKALKMVKVPPHKPVLCKDKQGRSFTSYQPDLTAPQSEWLEEWTFDLHTHA